jgi:hypothetical protein
MQLPAHIAERIRQTVAAVTPDLYIDEEARGHGAIALMGTLGAVWMLRPDGTFWTADADFGMPFEPLPTEWHIPALAYGLKRFAWLAELLPQRPADARDCPFCGGSRFLGPYEVLCHPCNGLGWQAA